MTVARRRSSTDDKVEAKRRIIRQSINEINAEIEGALRDADLRSTVNIVVPSRYSLVTISGARRLPPDQWSRMLEIVRQILGKKLGANELRGRPLVSGMATPDDFDDIALDTRS